jgi:PhnB protein
MQVQPYLFFEGRCEEALEFYKQALGAQVGMLLRYSDAPPPGPGGGNPSMPRPPADKVMHAEMRIGDTTLLCSDGFCNGATKFEGFSLTLACTSDAEAARLYDAVVTNGGAVQQPLEKTFFASCFGMAADRFGIGWMFIHRGDPQ